MESSNSDRVSGICLRKDVADAPGALTRLEALEPLDRRLASAIAAVRELDADVALALTCNRLTLLSAAIDLRAVIALDLIGADADRDAVEAAVLVTSYRLAIREAADHIAELERAARRTA